MVTINKNMECLEI